MKKILVFGGSTSSSSINRSLALYAASLLKESSFEDIDFSKLEVPIFSVDREKDGFPEVLVQLSDQFKSYDGFIISLAEHNGSYAAAYKNIIDWLSRINRSVFNDKPVLLMATSPGGRGGASVLAAAQAFYPHLGARIIDTFSLPKFHDHVSDGTLSSESLMQELQNKVTALENSLS